MEWVKRAAAIGAAVGALFGAGVARAVDDAVLQRLEELEDEVQSMNGLQQEVQLLKRRLEVKEEAEAAKGPGPLIGAGLDGFFLSSADRKWIVKLRGYAQSDSRWYGADEDDALSDAFLLRRVRPIFEGALAGWIDFRLMPDFANSSLVLQDAYANLRPFGALAQLQAGKFKAPFGLERLQSGTALHFIERGLPTQLAPNRDLGVQLWGDWRGGLLTYQLAVMNGVADGASTETDSNDAKEIVGRIFAKPFQETTFEPLQNFGIGAAFSWGHQNGTPSDYRTAGQQRFFRWASNSELDSGRWRAGPQLYWSWGPFGLLGEYYISDNTVQRSGDEGDVDVHSWQLATTYVLTGENASFNGVLPREPFSPGSGGFGAIELAARYGELTVDDEAFDLGFASASSSAEQAREVTGGVNWYLNRWLKLQLDYSRTWFEGGAPDGEDRDTEHFVATRLQLAY
ncbi:MAG: porin [Proteobacteria bacterium]|nr:MAG: porin [Pseudomonadota bacterium]